MWACLIELEVYLHAQKGATLSALRSISWLRLHIAGIDWCTKIYLEIRTHIHRLLRASTTFLCGICMVGFLWVGSDTPATLLRIQRMRSWMDGWIFRTKDVTFDHFTQHS